MNFFSGNEYLSGPIESLAGMGRVKCAPFLKKGLSQIWEIFINPPASYLDRREIRDLRGVSEGDEVVFIGVIEKISFAPHGRSLKAVVNCQDMSASLWWFRRFDYMKRFLRQGGTYLICGKAHFRAGWLNFSHPELWPLKPGYYGQVDIELLHQDPRLGIIPVYSPWMGLTTNLRKKINESIIDHVRHYPPLFPPEVLRPYGLGQPIELLSIVHKPPRNVKGKLPRPRESRAWSQLATLELAFWRLLIASFLPESQEDLSLVTIKAEVISAVERLWASLPFRPSSEQLRVTQEILLDLAVELPMNRLLQGEVGSGKTAVIAAAALSEMAQGRQVALMAPTSILAQQHLAFFERLGQELGFEVNYVSGTQSKAERKAVLHNLASGRPSLTVGTHALSTPYVIFKNLSLAIIDEQHRFGVKQRLALRDKCPKVNLLTVSATPIPASLANILYGDLKISSMVGILPGRQPALTKVFPARELDQARAALVKLVRAGHQAFVVCSRIKSSQLGKNKGRNDYGSDHGQSSEQKYQYNQWHNYWTEGENELATKKFKLDYIDKPSLLDESALRPEVETVTKELRELMPEVEIGQLHGQLNQEQRLLAMEAFRNGQSRVLVATSMVEVGVDIPGANVMMVEGADYFGLAQLHQLRGRVGRGGKASFFILVAGEKQSILTRERLKAIETNNDGYRLAELDLKLRGPGEELGLRQSGWPKLDFVKLPRDLGLLDKAIKLAKDLWDKRALWPWELEVCLNTAREEMIQTQNMSQNVED
ncbi:MAG: DEAD/DEAH box helicase [Deltaproteobacteria bacterium]|jgi:ATP-dependent DNA helicase RecG|nr:DEAD/DEAH box helicase [Deltaproteobacteria bacterium]